MVGFSEIFIIVEKSNKFYVAKISFEKKRCNFFNSTKGYIENALRANYHLVPYQRGEGGLCTSGAVIQQCKIWSCFVQFVKLQQFQPLFDEFISIFGKFRQNCMSMGFSIEMGYFVFFSHIKGQCLQIQICSGLKHL